MAGRPTLGAYEYDNDVSMVTIHWGGPSSSGTLLGQVLSFDWTETITGKTSQRISDSTEYETFVTKAVAWNATVAVDDDFSEVALVGYDTAKPSAGGWLGSESLAMSLTQTGKTVTITSWAGEASTSAARVTETMTAVKVKEAKRTLTPGEQDQYMFSGRADTLTRTPATALGA
jgi:hypothetical protein